MIIKYYGHANFFLKDKVNILIDPFFKGNPLIEDSRMNEVDPDFIIVTHAHGDHLGDTIEIARKTGAVVISNFEICNYFDKNNIKNHPLHIGGKLKFDWGYIKLVPAVHGSSFPDGSYGGHPAGVIIKMDGKEYYHAGDTGLSYEFKMLGETQDIYLAMLPVGDNFTMDIEDASQAAQWLRTKVVIPMHYNTFDFIKIKDDELEYAFRHFRLEKMEPGSEIVLE